MDGRGVFAHPRPAVWYARPTERVAKGLLGALLLCHSETGWRVGRIVETEAYVRGDPASHAYRGPRPRNRSMFAGPGTWYVYRIHQVDCLNVTTRTGEAVLIRAVEPLAGIEGDSRGPGRLCRSFGITRELDGRNAVDGPVRISPGPRRRERIVSGRRVGIRRAARRRLRFALQGNRWVSSPRPPAWRPAGRRPS